MPLASGVERERDGVGYEDAVVVFFLARTTSLGGPSASSIVTRK